MYINMYICKYIYIYYSWDRGCIFVAGVWQFLLCVLTPHEGSRFMRLRRVSCPLGRLRAWICSALNERSLERYLRVC